MSNPFISNSDIYKSNAERDISVILSRFSTPYIFTCIDNAIQLKTVNQMILPNPNLVRSLEESFNRLFEDYPDDKANIKEVREETYNEIINYLCSIFKIKFNDDGEVDLYSAAFYLYDFLVGDYLNKICIFFSEYILKEKNELYKAFELEKFKKNININYGKKMFKDNTTTIIIQQISYVLDQLMSFDFDFETIVNIAYQGNEVARFINSIYDDEGYFYNFYKNELMNQFIKPNIITNIRLYIQNKLMTTEGYTFVKGE